MKNLTHSISVAVMVVATVVLTSAAYGSEISGNLSTGLGNNGVSGVVIAAPAASVAAGTYNATQSVTLTASGSTSIHYTTDGTTPTCSTGTTYSSAISITLTTTIKALSCYPNSNASTVASFAYVLACATPTVANGTVAAYPSCSISCNSGYTVSGSSCVATSSGGSGGSYTPTAPTSTVGAVTAAGGGAVTFTGSDSSSVKVTVPPQAVSGTTSITIATITNSGGSAYNPPASSTGLFMVGGTIYQLTAVSGVNNITTFAQPLTLQFHYLDSQLPAGTSESSLQIYYFDSSINAWVAISGTVDPVSNLVTVTVNHFTKFALLAKVGTVSYNTPSPTGSCITSGGLATGVVADAVALAQALCVTRDSTAESAAQTKVVASAKEFKITLGGTDLAVASNFVAYGTSTATIALGSGERLALLRDQFETLGRVSVGALEQLAVGTIPTDRNLPKEQAAAARVLANFKRMVNHAPNFKVAKENLAWNTLMYRIRFTRDVSKEKVGIVKFKALFNRNPKTPMEWAIVRAWGYVLVAP